MDKSLAMDAQGIALYTRLARLLRSRIIDGEWKVGAMLPPIPFLASEYSVGSATVRQALRLLSNEGLIVSERGRGTSVRRAITPAQSDSALLQGINDPLDLAPDQTIQILSKERVRELPAFLRDAGTPHGEYVRIVKTHRHAGEVFTAMEIYVHAAEFSHFPRGAERDFKIGRLVRQYGRAELRSLRQLMTVTTLDDATARLMEVESSDYYHLAGVVVRVLRWWLDDVKNIVVAGIHYYRADLFALDFTQAAPPHSALPATLPTMVRTPKSLITPSTPSRSNGPGKRISRQSR